MGLIGKSRLLALALLVASCGMGGSKQNTSTRQLGAVEQSIRDSANTNGIPESLILAVGLMESGLMAEASSTTYANSKLSLGFKQAETAFGLERSELGLEAGADLKTQISAYGSWLRGKLDEKKLELSSDLADPDALYDWIWQIAQLHRQGNESKKNVQIVFAKELLHLLSTGYTWKDPDSQELIVLTPREQSLDEDSFSSPIQRNLRLDTQRSEIFAVDYLQLNYEPIGGPENTPEFVRVIHCPFSISACLDIQSRSDTSKQAMLQAHYVIPSDDTILSNPIKIRQHKTPVQITNIRGEKEEVNNAVVVMLTGDSGRYVDGSRLAANPNWYTNNQLKTFGKVLRGICSLMRLEQPEKEFSSCEQAGVEAGVQFQHQGQSSLYRWGDIADYDENIFWAYVRNPEELSGQVEFSFPVSQISYQAGSPISFQLDFITGTSKIIIELIEKCESNKLVWTTLETRFIRNVSSQPFELRLYDPGANGNGEHFLRALVFDQDNQLSGWAVSSVLLSNYDEDNRITANTKVCQRL